MFVLNPAHITETVRNIARKIEEDRTTPYGHDMVGCAVLADALEEAGSTSPLLSYLRGTYSFEGLAIAVRRIAEGYDYSREWAAYDAAEQAKAEAERKAARDRVCLFSADVTGCGYTQKELQTRITRKRPKGSGSKADLAKRLETAMNKLADRRWKLACKGQRKATATQVAEVLAAVESALQAQQGRAKERKIDAADVLTVARKADAYRNASIDGGRVTANSYGYRWETTTASAYRNADGTIAVSIGRNGSPSRLTFPARVWATVEA